ncbi:MAG: terminase small subunit [Sulfuricella sp.]
MLTQQSLELQGKSEFPAQNTRLWHNILMARTGRPLKFASAEQINKASEDYFQKCEKSGQPITITGLCLVLGTFRDVLLDYAGGKYDEKDREFSNSIKRAKLRCEHYAETQAFSGKNPAGAIFALKNYGWSDKQQTEITGEVRTIMVKPESKERKSRPALKPEFD